MEDKPDFTGLKIQELVLEDSEDEVKQGESGADDAEKDGPWKKAQPTHLEAQIAGRNVVKEVQAPTPTPTPAPVKEEPVAPVEEKGEAGEGQSNEDSGSEKADGSTTTEENKSDEPVKKTYMTPAARRAAEEAAKRPAPAPVPVAAAAAPSYSTPACDGPPMTPKPLSSGGGGAYVPPSKRMGAPSSQSGESITSLDFSSIEF